MGLLGGIVGLVVLAVGLVGAIGAGAYAADYGVQATVTKKDCKVAPPVVDFQLKTFNRLITKPVDDDACSILRPGNFVVYHIRTGRTTIYTREGGTCLYDNVDPCVLNAFT